MVKATAQSDLSRVFRTAKLVCAGLGILLVLLYLVSGFYSIKPEERGVVKRFGRVVNDNVLPGIHYHWPWPIEVVLRLATTEIRSMTVNFGFEPGSAAQSSTKEAEALLTGDENVVLASLLIQYMIDKPGSYLFRITNGPEWLLGRIVKAVCVKNVAEMAVDKVLTTGRFLLQTALKKGVQTLANEYDLGIRITSIQIQNLQPPAKVAGAFRDVSSAREDMHKVVRQAEGNRNRQLPTARSKAHRTIAEAQAYAKEVEATAEGDANRFVAAWEEYRKAKNITIQRLYLEAMERIFPKTKKVISNPRAEKLLMGNSNVCNNRMELPVPPKNLYGDRETPYSQR